MLKETGPCWLGAASIGTVSNVVKAIPGGSEAIKLFSVVCCEILDTRIEVGVSDSCIMLPFGVAGDVGMPDSRGKPDEIEVVIVDAKDSKVLDKFIVETSELGKRICRAALLSRDCVGSTADPVKAGNSIDVIWG